MTESLQCPRCNCSRGRVLETRSITLRGYFILLRVRICDHCGKQFRSKEITDQSLKLPAVSRKKEEDKIEEPVLLQIDSQYEELPPLPQQEEQTTCETGHNSILPDIPLGHRPRKQKERRISLAAKVNPPKPSPPRISPTLKLNPFLKR